MKSIFLGAAEQINRVYSGEVKAELSSLTGLSDKVYTKDSEEDFSEVEYIFSTWGMPEFDKEEIAEIFPRLEAVFYAAGSVQRFARPFLESGIQVFSAWAANGIPVAEYTVAQIILANKGFFQTARCVTRAEAEAVSKNFLGNYGAKVGIIGAGMIGKLVIQMLKAYRLQVSVFDPFLTEEEATRLGVTKCSLETLFSECNVVSNHLANNTETKGMLTYQHFSAMPKYATFINTGRGAQVVERDLIAVLKARADLTAILDVTDPEPPDAGSPFYSLPNCILTPHIAGSIGNEVRRMGEFMREEARAFSQNSPCRYEVTLEMLKTMA